MQEQKLQERLDQEHKREKFNMPMHGKKKKGMARGGAMKKKKGMARGGAMMKKKKGMARGGAMKKKKGYARGGAARRR